jgi:serine protease inhibitor
MITPSRTLLFAGMVVLTAALGIAAVLIFSKRGGDAGTVVAIDLDIDPDPLPDADPSWTDRTSAVTANNDFAFDLYAQLAREKNDSPLFFSPYSISNALVMAAEGARKETADEMGKALRLPAATRRTGDDAAERPWDLGMIHQGLALLRRQFAAASRAVPKDVRDRLDSLHKELKAANEVTRETNSRPSFQKAQKIADEINQLQEKIDRYELLVANGLWGEKTYPFKQAYLDTISRYYGASMFPVDFRNDFEGARKQINAWVEKRTRDRIKELIPPEALNDLTRLVLTNAIYFKGRWSTPFDVGSTKDLPFTLAEGTKIETPTMHHSFEDDARYGAFKKDAGFFATPTHFDPDSKDTSRLYPDTNGFEMIELPYKGMELSMVVIAPRSAGGLPALEKVLNGRTLQTCIGKLQQREVHVYLPKFKLESSFDLKTTLQTLGMKRAFRGPSEKEGAQFDGMTDTSEPKRKLFIDKVMHKAFVEVNEKGTEAAAATGLIMKSEKSPKEEPFTPTFRADRPFVFLIREQKTGAILFLGRVLNPKIGA